MRWPFIIGYIVGLVTLPIYIVVIACCEGRFLRTLKSNAVCAPSTPPAEPLGSEAPIPADPLEEPGKSAAPGHGQACSMSDDTDIRHKLTGPSLRFVLSGILEWLPYLIERGELPDSARSNIHAITRKVRMSDEDLDIFAQQNGWPTHNDPYDECYGLLSMLQDLRDRYEERGEYAPAPISPTLPDVDAATGTADDLIPAPVVEAIRDTLCAPPNALTRKVTMSDEELARLIVPDGLTVAEWHTDPPAETLIKILQDLRDRYEERGQYAPAGTVAESGPNKS